MSWFAISMEVKHQNFNVLSLVGGRKPTHIKSKHSLHVVLHGQTVFLRRAPERESGHVYYLYQLLHYYEWLTCLQMQSG